MKKNSIQIRKILLLSLIALLTVTLICQLAIKGSNHAYKLSLKGDIDAITIINENETIRLYFEDGQWFIGTHQEANENAVKLMKEFLQAIPVLGTVSHNADDERYGFGPSSIKITAERKGKVVRSLEIGKNSVTNQQVYCRLDEKKEVVLVGQNPRNIFDHGFNELLQK